MQPSIPSLQCEVCGARAFTLRRGRCWICYVRWAESRPVGMGASCVICNDRRRDNLRSIELHGSWIPMCHNCGTKALRLAPIPATVEGLRQRLARDRRWQDRRQDTDDTRLLQKERRVGERRFYNDQQHGEWVSADELIIEVIEMPEDGDFPVEATRISGTEIQESNPSGG